MPKITRRNAFVGRFIQLNPHTYGEKVKTPHLKTEVRIHLDLGLERLTVIWDILSKNNIR